MTLLILYNQPSNRQPSNRQAGTDQTEIDPADTGPADTGPADSDPADSDVLTQVAWVGRALSELGYQVDALGVTLDLTPLEERLRTQPPEFVVYLVESLGGTDGLLHLPAELLAARSFPFTGSPASVLKSLVSKSEVKQRLLAEALPTPGWLDPEGDFHGGFAPGQYIIKADREHASRGLDQTSVVEVQTVDELRGRCRQRASQLKVPCLAERFVSGREFNIALLAGERDEPTPGVEVLPLAEIDFSRLPAGHWPIVDWKAKWAEGSVEYVGTPRTFPDMQAQSQLGQQLRWLAERCWQTFGLSGYARVDVRVDPQGDIWILEINANPCLSPDAGFHAACSVRGLSATDIMQRLIPTPRAYY